MYWLKFMCLWLAKRLEWTEDPKCVAVAALLKDLDVPAGRGPGEGLAFANNFTPGGEWLVTRMLSFLPTEVPASWLGMRSDRATLRIVLYSDVEATKAIKAVTKEVAMINLGVLCADDACNPAPSREENFETLAVTPDS